MGSGLISLKAGRGAKDMLISLWSLDGLPRQPAAGTTSTVQVASLRNVVDTRALVLALALLPNQVGAKRYHASLV